ncbi:uncharacterized protein LOC130655235 isoform X2 [Hydractinia symbiolongicarpus]|uniref:uncharacterized protein LOC130655235 isoform X2 n=1 Tax=Hydractinia symbiolongicarpus TaxID=13093 RepID=UPI002549CEE1|nr:uncharacterized protein LOC130655235 isoform X2 [Hydractinia symbiolongicarpus]
MKWYLALLIVYLIQYASLKPLDDDNQVQEGDDKRDKISTEPEKPSPADIPADDSAAAVDAPSDSSQGDPSAALEKLGSEGDDATKPTEGAEKKDNTGDSDTANADAVKKDTAGDADAAKKDDTGDAVTSPAPTTVVVTTGKIDGGATTTATPSKEVTATDAPSKEGTATDAPATTVKPSGSSTVGIKKDTITAPTPSNRPSTLPSTSNKPPTTVPTTVIPTTVKKTTKHASTTKKHHSTAAPTKKKEVGASQAIKRSGLVTRRTTTHKPTTSIFDLPSKRHTTSATTGAPTSTSPPEKKTVEKSDNNTLTMKGTTFHVGVRFLDEKFTDDLNFPKNPVYQSLKKHVMTTVAEVYKNYKDYKQVVVIKFSDSEKKDTSGGDDKRDDIGNPGVIVDFYLRFYTASTHLDKLTEALQSGKLGTHPVSPLFVRACKYNVCLSGSSHNISSYITSCVVSYLDIAEPKGRVCTPDCKIQCYSYCDAGCCNLHVIQHIDMPTQSPVDALIQQQQQQLQQPCQGATCTSSPPPPQTPCEGSSCQPAMPQMPCQGASCAPQMPMPQMPCLGPSCQPAMPQMPCQGASCQPAMPPVPCQGASCQQAMPQMPCQGASCAPQMQQMPCQGMSCQPQINPCRGSSCTPPPQMMPQPMPFINYAPMPPPMMQQCPPSCSQICAPSCPNQCCGMPPQMPMQQMQSPYGAARCGPRGC